MQGTAARLPNCPKLARNIHSRLQQFGREIVLCTFYCNFLALHVSMVHPQLGALTSHNHRGRLGQGFRWTVARGVASHNSDASEQEGSAIFPGCSKVTPRVPQQRLHMTASLRTFHTHDLRRRVLQRLSTIWVSSDAASKPVKCKMGVWCGDIGGETVSCTSTVPLTAAQGRSRGACACAAGWELRKYGMKISCVDCASI